jgi:hypothetical protein
MRFFDLTISKWDIFKTDHWKNVSYCISLLISNFSSRMEEFWPNWYEISQYDEMSHCCSVVTYFLNNFRYPEFEIQDYLLFQSRPCLFTITKFDTKIVVLSMVFFKWLFLTSYQGLCNCVAKKAQSTARPL